jgi:hypothetical protein
VKPCRPQPYQARAEVIRFGQLGVGAAQSLAEDADDLEQDLLVAGADAQEGLPSHRFRTDRSFDSRPALTTANPHALARADSIKGNISANLLPRFGLADGTTLRQQL